MAYTQADLDSIRTALKDLATGKRVSEVVYQGRKVKYTDVDLPTLQQLENTIATAIARSTRVRFGYIRSGKGL